MLRRVFFWTLAVAAATALAMALWGAGGPGRWARQVLRPATPHERYAAALREAGLAESALGRQWFDAATSATARPVTMAMPFREDGYFDPAHPSARGYLVSVPDGQKLRIECSFTGEQRGALFVDLFERVAEGTSARARAFAEVDTMLLEHEPSRGGDFVLRVQPELLRGGRVEIIVRVLPVLGFPVSGTSDADVRSGFGVARDGGRRRHEGVDIFAPRGTPVVSAGGGVVTRVGETALGGRVVWVWDAARRHMVYYAHLDEQRAHVGQRVRPGDEVGTVGNTGNARTTPPHLHFGIYRSGEGAIDPQWFIRRVAEPVPPRALDAARLGALARNRSRTGLREAPAADARTAADIDAQTPLVVEGVVGPWARVRLPAGSPGFVDVRALDRADAPFATRRLRAPQPLFDGPGPGAATRALLPATTRVGIYGRYASRVLVRDPGGVLGWLDEGAL